MKTRRNQKVRKTRRHKRRIVKKRGGFFRPFTSRAEEVEAWGDFIDKLTESRLLTPERRHLVELMLELMKNSRYVLSNRSFNNMMLRKLDEAAEEYPDLIPRIEIVRAYVRQF